MLDDVERRLVAAYRVHTVPDARTKAALLERLHDAADDPARASWRRIGIAAGLAIAIAAAVLLLVRGAVLLVAPADRAPPEAVFGVDSPRAPAPAEPVPPRPPVVVQPAAATPAAAPALPAPRAPARPVDAAASSLAEEARLLARAQVAMRDADTTAATAALTEHARRFPAGTMALERDALQVIVRCTIGRDAAAIASARVLADDPRARSYAARIRDACGL